MRFGRVAGMYIETSARERPTGAGNNLYTSGHAYAVSPDGGTRVLPFETGRTRPSTSLSGGTGPTADERTPLRAQKVKHASMRWGQAPDAR